MEQNNQSYLATEKVGKLMGKYAVPCIISLLVGALYNIVDQIFIANADYLGSYGNAANTVVFPLTVIALGIAVMIGDGTCAFVSISLGANKKDDAHKSVGNAILLCIVSSIVLTYFYGPHSDSIWRKSKRRNFCLCQRVLFLDCPRHPVLYVRSGDEPDHPFRR